MGKINPEIETFARIKIIGVGGSGKNALNHMINAKVRGVEFIAMNTDTQDLHNSLADKKIHIGKNLTKGLGAGMNPEVGQKAAEETKAEIQDSIKGSDMVFIACGLGGGTGTGAAPIIARAAKEQGILTVAVVTKPFFFEGNQRMRLAEHGLAELEKEVDAIIVIPNDRLLAVAGKDMSFKDAFAKCDEILRQAVEGISDLITTPGVINVDFADIRAVMSDTGTALMGIGIAGGEGRATRAATDAINSPLLDLSINGARGVLLAISGGEDLTIHEVQEAAQLITESIDKDARVIFGMIKDDRMKKGEMKVTVIATGFPTDISKKSLFSNTTNSFPQKTKEVEKEPEPEPSIVRKEIHNTMPTKNEYLKKNDKNIVKEKDMADLSAIIDDAFEDDNEDWSAVPAFLRRKK